MANLTKEKFITRDQTIPHGFEKVNLLAISKTNELLFYSEDKVLTRAALDPVQYITLTEDTTLTTDQNNAVLFLDEGLSGLTVSLPEPQMGLKYTIILKGVSSGLYVVEARIPDDFDRIVCVLNNNGTFVSGNSNTINIAIAAAIGTKLELYSDFERWFAYGVTTTSEGGFSLPE